jgi:hypothetical protein
MTDRRVQIECAMRLATVQINRHADNRDVRDREGIEQELPPRKAKQPMSDEIKQRVEQGYLPVRRRDSANATAEAYNDARQESESMRPNWTTFYLKGSKSL